MMHAAHEPLDLGPTWLLSFNRAAAAAAAAQQIHQVTEHQRYSSRLCIESASTPLEHTKTPAATCATCSYGRCA
eukprot:16689-Heterococcus_DN1.PRE.1